MDDQRTDRASGGSIKPVALHPRLWSQQFATAVQYTFALIAISLIGISSFLGWRGRELSGVEPKNIVEHDAEGYYQRYPHIKHMKNRITNEQAENYFQYRRYQDWIGTTGGAFITLTVLVVFLRRGAELKKS